jgi:hypothetical protein
MATLDGIRADLGEIEKMVGAKLPIPLTLMRMTPYHQAKKRNFQSLVTKSEDLLSAIGNGPSIQPAAVQTFAQYACDLQVLQL